MRGVVMSSRRLRWALARLAFAMAAGLPLTGPPCAWAQEEPRVEERPVKFSVYARQGVSRLWPARESRIGDLDGGSRWGHETELRFMADIRWGSFVKLELHNETFYQGGPARRAMFELTRSPDAVLPDADGLMDDRRRLSDFSWTLNRTPERLLVTRLDRLSASVFLGRSTVKVGRHVVAWGNGLLFNPFDLFSPFAPMEIDRDYKRGEDGASWAIDAGDRFGDFEVVSLFKRDGAAGKAGSPQVSLGVKHHRLLGVGAWEITSLAGRHFGDLVFGGGVMGRVGDVVGRSEWVHTVLADGAGSATTGVVNLDVAGVWKGMNSHAGVEYYFSGLGASADADPHAGRVKALQTRLARGDLFVRGRHYLDSLFDVEAHPLVRVALNTVTNLSDGSGMLQPSMSWDATSRIQARLTATYMWGGRGTEFGGVQDRTTGLNDRMPTRIDVRVTTTF